MSLSRAEAPRFIVQSVVQDAFAWQNGRFRPLIGLSLTLGTLIFLLNAFLGHLPWIGFLIHAVAMSGIFIVVVRHRFTDESADIFVPVGMMRLMVWFLVASAVAQEVFEQLVVPLAALQIPPNLTIGFGLLATVAGSYIFARTLPKLVAISLGLKRPLMECFRASKPAGFRIVYGTLLVAVLPLMIILINGALLYLLTSSGIGTGFGILVVALTWFADVLVVTLYAAMAGFLAEAFQRLRQLDGDVQA